MIDVLYSTSNNMTHASFISLNIDIEISLMLGGCHGVFRLFCAEIPICCLAYSSIRFM